jgi:hypothetical protein
MIVNANSSAIDTSEILSQSVVRTGDKKSQQRLGNDWAKSEHARYLTRQSYGDVLSTSNPSGDIIGSISDRCI